MTTLPENISTMNSLERLAIHKTKIPEEQSEFIQQKGNMLEHFEQMTQFLSDDELDSIMDILQDL